MRRRTVLASLATLAATAGCSGRDDSAESSDPSGEQAVLPDDCPTTPVDSSELPERGKSPAPYPDFPAEIGLESALEFARSVEETYQHNWNHEEGADVEVDHSGSSITERDDGFAVTVEGTATVAVDEQTEVAEGTENAKAVEERDYEGRYYLDETLVRRAVGENVQPSRGVGALFYCRE